MTKRKTTAIILIAALALTILSLTGCQNNGIVCENVKIQNGTYVLDGELTLPKDGNMLPSVVIVSGSGAMDMDGKIGAQKPYKDLAYNLAKKGVASIRFNKVTFQYATETARATDFTVDDEYFLAMESCIKLLRQTERLDKNKIFLLGHSLGSQMVAVELQKDSALCGGIIMAGTTAHILDILLEQAAAQSQTLYEEYLPYCQKAKNLSEVPFGEENHYYFGAYSAYWVSYNSLDRLAISQTKCPLLILQGGMDLQVSTEHFENYKTLLTNRTNVVFKEYSQLNHLFSDGRGETVQTAYRRIGKIPQEVIDDIAQFILQQG